MDTLLILGVAGAAAWYFLFGPGKSAVTTTTTTVPTTTLPIRMVPDYSAPASTKTGIVNTTTYTSVDGGSVAPVGSFVGLGWV